MPNDHEYFTIDFPALTAPPESVRDADDRPVTGALWYSPGDAEGFVLELKTADGLVMVEFDFEQFHRLVGAGRRALDAWCAEHADEIAA